ncbi:MULTISPECIES: response regulator transcription factor [unclassified Acutalibacter]|jgi:two-component system response regulator RegX3|uniref:response regulator transcription factor n=1 Tax=unclassified Acutalibacter TaxID=2620728 RepID=UPI0014133F0F|nr:MULTISPECIES: response regulator transcription factor [unclassified Acutalibacter]MCI9224885.1 response regulator transcription factor [Acutalibacter sp.]NBJ90357.1 DNA-binding response regulator [Acutalibacter sp. 1XD8-36]
MKKVLVAEDEQNIREFVVINLERAGYEITEAESGDQALELYRRGGGDFHVVILDIMMPGARDGLAVCRELRSQNPTLGIILLTAKTQEMDKVSGLMMGADDYVTKPFSPSELVARVDAVYRRVALAAERYESVRQDQLAAGEFTLNLRDRSFTKGGAPVELTQVEFQIMEYFLENPGIALARGDILRHVWGPSYVGEEKIVDVNIRRLRMKVEDEPSNPQHITTVWGLGYRWKN